MPSREVERSACVVDNLFLFLATLVAEMKDQRYTDATMAAIDIRAGDVELLETMRQRARDPDNSDLASFAWLTLLLLDRGR